MLAFSLILICLGSAGLYFKIEYAGWVLFAGLVVVLGVMDGDYEDVDEIKQIAWNEGRNAPRGSSNPYNK